MERLELVKKLEEFGFVKGIYDDDENTYMLDVPSLNKLHNILKNELINCENADNILGLTKLSSYHFVLYVALYKSKKLNSYFVKIDGIKFICNVCGSTNYVAGHHYGVGKTSINISNIQNIFPTSSKYCCLTSLYTDVKEDIYLSKSKYTTVDYPAELKQNVLKASVLRVSEDLKELFGILEEFNY